MRGLNRVRSSSSVVKGMEHGAWGMGHGVKRDERDGRSGETGKKERGQRSEIRGRRSEVRDQIEDCGLGNLGFEIWDVGCEISDWRMFSDLKDQ